MISRIFILVLLSAWSLNAGTYYISFSTGNNANPGTQAQPWKTHPYMKNWTGSYTHTAGDRFIFRGGDTWPVSAFQMKILQGGNSSGNPDTYVSGSPSWGTGKAVFDFENTSLGAWLDNYGVFIVGTSPYITFSDIDFKRHRNDQNYGSSTINVQFSGTGGITFTNCFIRDWSMPSPMVGYGNVGGGIWWTSGDGLVIVDTCDLHQQNVAIKNGIALKAVNVVQNCEIHHTATGWNGQGTVRYNRIHDLVASGDPTSHQEAIHTFGVSQVYGNVIYNLVALNEGDGIPAPIELSPGYNSTSGDEYVYNNVIYNTQTQTPIWGKTGRPEYANIREHIYNNTIYRSGGMCVNLYEVGGIKWQAAYVTNNHFITEGNPLDVSGATTIGHGKNLTNTVAQATANGYVAGNEYAPSSSGSPTVAQGANLSSLFTSTVTGETRTPLWDVGAYEWESAPGALGTARLSTDSYSVGEEDGQVTITAQRVSGATGILTVPYTTANGTALSGVNYTTTAGDFVWGNGDTADKTVDVPITDADIEGNPEFTFSISGDVSAPTSATVTIMGSGTPGPPPILSGLSWPVTDAEILAPFVLDTDNVYQPEDTQGAPDMGGTMTFTFVPAETGIYSGSMLAKALEAYQNSCYFNINTNPPVDPTSIYDVPLSADYATNTVSFRGTGTFESPEIPVMTWALTAGTTNTVYVRGREPLLRIKRVTLTLLNPPATPVPVVVVGSSATDGYYKAGQTIPISVQFSTNVTVTGTPALALNTGGTATYASGSGTSTLTFNYLVLAGHNNQDLDYSSTSALTLEGGTIQHSGTDATLDLAAPGTAGSIAFSRAIVVDTIAPTVTIGAPSVASTSTGPVLFSITYSDTNFSLSTLSTGDVMVSTTDTVAGAVTVATLNPSPVQSISVHGLTGDGTFAVAIAAGTAVDLAGNLAPIAGPSASVIVVQPAPAPTPPAVRFLSIQGTIEIKGTLRIAE